MTHAERIVLIDMSSGSIEYHIFQDGYADTLGDEDKTGLLLMKAILMTQALSDGDVPRLQAATAIYTSAWRLFRVLPFCISLCIDQCHIMSTAQHSTAQHIASHHHHIIII